MKVLLTGSSGQLGKCIIQLKPEKVELIQTKRNDLDLSDFNSCKRIINKYQPDWVLNCGAYTNVDKAEKDKDLVLAVNSDAPKAFAEELKNTGGKILQISTDFVFNGDQRIPYKPYQERCPINIYGISKAKGEEAIENILGKTNQALILRTSWVISPYGRNFALTMLKLHKEREEISVVSDQVGGPTSAQSLANLCWTFIKSNDLCFKEKLTDCPIFHFSNSGYASWYDLSLAVGEIGEELGIISKKALVKPILSKDYPTNATRPKYSLLDCSKTYKFLGEEATHWKEELRNIIKSIRT